MNVQGTKFRLKCKPVIELAKYVKKKFNSIYFCLPQRLENTNFSKLLSSMN